MILKMTDKTRSSVRLCDTCVHSRIIKGPQQYQEEVHCHEGGHPSRIIFPVVECNMYKRMGELDEWDAKQIGWVLEVKAGKVLGFKPPSKDDK